MRDIQMADQLLQCGYHPKVSKHTGCDPLLTNSDIFLQALTGEKVLNTTNWLVL